MRIEQTTQDRYAIIALHGDLDLAAGPQLGRVLRKRLAEQPVAVICDLAGLHTLDPACASIFASVAAHPATNWPATSLLLCGARPQVAATLDRLRLAQVLPLYPTVQAAVAHATARPPSQRQELALAASPMAPATARRFVRALCESWRLSAPPAPDDPIELEVGAWTDELVDQAVLLVSELVTNAVVHTTTPTSTDTDTDTASVGAGPAGRPADRVAEGELCLSVELRGTRLYLAVQDPTPRLLHLAPTPALDPEAEGGRGLWLVEQLATAWGAHPAAGAGGGKVVWCALTCEPADQ